MHFKLGLFLIGTLKHIVQFEYDDKYFPKKKVQDGHSAIQIGSSGPAYELHQIEFGYTKMIMSAKNLFIFKHLTLYQIDLTLMH